MANRQMARLFLVDMIQDAHFSHFEENPLVQGTVLEAAPKAVIGYDHRNDAHDAETWLHFYVHDHRFLPLYQPQRRQEILRVLKTYGGGGAGAADPPPDPPGAHLWPTPR